MYTLIEYMPRHLRASHRAARNSGLYPRNGSCRVWIAGHPGDVEDSLDAEWSRVIRGQAITPGDDDYPIVDDIPSDAMGGIGY